MWFPLCYSFMTYSFLHMQVYDTFTIGRSLMVPPAGHTWFTQIHASFPLVSFWFMGLRTQQVLDVTLLPLHLNQASMKFCHSLTTSSWFEAGCHLTPVLYWRTARAHTWTWRLSSSTLQVPKSSNVNSSTDTACSRYFLTSRQVRPHWSNYCTSKPTQCQITSRWPHIHPSYTTGEHFRVHFAIQTVRAGIKPPTLQSTN